MTGRIYLQIEKFSPHNFRVNILESLNLMPVLLTIVESRFQQFYNR